MFLRWGYFTRVFHKFPHTMNICRVIRFSLLCFVLCYHVCARVCGVCVCVRAHVYWLFVFVCACVYRSFLSQAGPQGRGGDDGCHLWVHRPHLQHCSPQESAVHGHWRSCPQGEDEPAEVTKIQGRQRKLVSVQGGWRDCLLGSECTRHRRGGGGRGCGCWY